MSIGFVAFAVAGFVLFWAWSKHAHNKVVTYADDIFGASRGKKIAITDSLTGEQLGELKSKTFRELLTLYAENTGEISSFYILRESLGMLTPTEGLSKETIAIMASLVGEKDHVDVVWTFE